MVNPSIDGRQSRHSNPWVEHVRAYAKKHNLQYFEALRDPKVKKGYKSKKGGTITASSSAATRLNEEMNRMISELRQLSEQGFLPVNETEAFQMEIYDLRINRGLTTSEKYDELLNIYKRVRRRIGDITPEAF